MRDQTKTTIDGVEYGLIKLGGFEALPLFTRLLKLLGPALAKILIGELTKAKKENKSVLDADVGQMFEKLSTDFDKFFEKLTEDDFEYLLGKIFKQEYFFADGKKVMDVKKQLNSKGLKHLLFTLKFGLQVNFSDFLPESIEF